MSPDELIRVTGEAAEDAAMRWVGRDLGTIHRDTIAAEILAAVLPKVADAIEALRQRHFAEYGADETGPRNYDWALTQADRLVRSLAEGVQP